ncbi:hypothetical protein [Amycolatopsis sp. YIM 10]|uniref:hypothetical protein n=1 Tax=Amycolatopsis sp. YIM 10 TaxID=2653857 RepID=UPI001290211E|nr:hypothetical protein [Amycolatopsis sp. YIM 10]
MATSIALLTAVVVLATGCAVWFGVEAGRLSEGDPSANLALVDTAATAEVSDQVGAAVKAIFSYDYANLDRTERAAGGLLVDKAVNQYRDSFAAAKRQAEAEKLVRTTTIRSAGVRELRADSARLLIFLDQQTLRPGENGQTSSAAHLDVHAKKIDGSWKIAELTAL